jgi:hypothetical protein
VVQGSGLSLVDQRGGEENLEEFRLKPLERHCRAETPEDIMIIKLIIVLDNDTLWIKDAWDEYTLEENFDEYLQILEHCKKRYDQVRELDVQIPDGTLNKLFATPLVSANVTL